MRLLAIDYGTRRVGFAICDPSEAFVFPVDVATVSSDAGALDAIERAVAEHDAEAIVLGLPLNMDGTEGPSAARVRRFAQSVVGRVNLPVRLVDERQSSLDAEATLVTRKRGGERVTRKRKQAQLDALAAVEFLRAHLMEGRPSIDVLGPPEPGRPSAEC